jgi:hypothetical protein
MVGDTELFNASPELTEYSQKIGGLIYPMAFVFQFVIATFYVFVRISLFAAIGLWIGELMKRRVEYRFIWRTAAIAITVPLLLTIILDFFPAWETFGIFFSSLVHICYLILAFKYYPKVTK